MLDGTVSLQRSKSLDHVLAELKRVDELIQKQVQRIRKQAQNDDQLQGLFISDQEVDTLLATPSCSPAFPALTEKENASATQALPPFSGSRLSEFSDIFQLSPLETDCLLICLAPELDCRYERLYAYLQNDVTKKRPSVDLVLNLLCRSVDSKIWGRRLFVSDAALIRNRLVQLFEDPSHPQPTLLGKGIKVDEHIVNYLLESDDVDGRLKSYVKCVQPRTALEELVLTNENKRRVAWLAERTAKAGSVVFLHGLYGSGRQGIAEALCLKLKRNLLILDGKRLASASEPDFRSVAELAAREAVLKSAALYVSDFQALLAEDKGTLRGVLLDELNAHARISFLASEVGWDPTNELSSASFFRLELAQPSFAERLQLWQAAIGTAEGIDLSGVATKFRFTPGQIRDAAATARNLACWRASEMDKVTTADVNEACRLQCNRKLSTLARKIKPHYAWTDIILPFDRAEQLREICNALKYRSLVYDQWGFERKLSLGKGLNVLFAGPPGTGKTMAADVMAAELGLDLYKTDLSSVVSKYIGETEKNLSRIFAEAETSNAILFFDEADALFGKRSEVRDSHDRYANIEINYLLQKMEEHEGVVILATNFRKNMDDAFVRRLHFTIDFPLPDETDRLRIWEAIWPKETPRDVELDLQAIARRFALPGGNIRNIAISAAFLAAQNGGVVNMQHLLHATRREYQKMGKVVMHGEFEEDEPLRRV